MEGEQEKFPTREEIFELLKIDQSKCIGEIKEKSDGNKLTCLEFTIEGRAKGQTIEYQYLVSTFTRNETIVTEIDINETEFDETGDCFQLGGENIYRYKNGAWKDLREKK